MAIFGGSRRRRARRLSDQARAALTRAPVVDDDGVYARTSVVGPDPIRVLLFGSGPLIGYGVTRRDDAVDGGLARLVAATLNRGVTVESRVALRSRIDTAVQSLGGAGTSTFSIAVWAPPFSEELVSLRRTRAQVRKMLQSFREQSQVPLVLCELPFPLGADWRSVLRRPRVQAFNRMLHQESSRLERIFSVPTGTYTPATAAMSVGAEWQQAFAAHLLPTVLHALGHESGLRLG